MEQMKTKLTGLTDIYRFTVVQSLKAKSMKIVTIILCILALCSVPVITLINGGDKKKDTSIKTVRVVDLTGLNLLEDITALSRMTLQDAEESGHKSTDPSVSENESDSVAQSAAKEEKNVKDSEEESAEDRRFENVAYIAADIDFSKFDQNTKKKDIYTFEKEADYIYMQITYMDNAFYTEILYSDDTKVKKADVQAFTTYVEENFNKILLAHAGLTPQQQRTVNSTEIIRYQEELDDTETPSDLKKDNADETKYWIIYSVTMVVLIAMSFGGERVAMNILTDKASKVMEYLLTFVKPMAVILGKIAASITLLLFQMLLVLISFIGSIVINGLLVSEEHAIVLPSFLKGFLSTENFSSLNVASVLIAVLILLGGFLFYGLVAGLAGASVSKLEEITEGIKIYTLLLIISAYVVLFAVVQSRTYDGTSIIRYVTILLPPTSVFFVPALLVTGYMTIVEGLGSLAVMAVGVFLMIRFVADVYESMVYYNGAPLKLKDIIQISKQKKMAGGKSK